MLPDIPAVGNHIWLWFLELDRRRCGNGFGLNPITFSEIANFCALTGTVMRPFEVRAVAAIDTAYTNELARGSEKPNAPKMIKATTENLKAVFRMMQRKKKKNGPRGTGRKD